MFVQWITWKWFCYFYIYIITPHLISRFWRATVNKTTRRSPTSTQVYQVYIFCKEIVERTNATLFRYAMLKDAAYTILFIQLYCIVKQNLLWFWQPQEKHINLLDTHAHTHTQSIHQALWFYFYISHLGIHSVVLQPHALCRALATSNHVDDKLAVEMCSQHLSLM